MNQPAPPSPPVPAPAAPSSGLSAPPAPSSPPAVLRETFGAARGAAVAVAVLALICLTVALVCTACRLQPDHLVALIQAHGPAVIGMPVSAILGLAIVCLARGIGGPVSIQIIGLRAEGATATVLLWIATFAASAFAIRALW